MRICLLFVAVALSFLDLCAMPQGRDDALGPNSPLKAVREAFVTKTRTVLVSPAPLLRQKSLKGSALTMPQIANSAVERRQPSDQNSQGARHDTQDLYGRCDARASERVDSYDFHDTQDSVSPRNSYHLPTLDILDSSYSSSSLYSSVLSDDEFLNTKKKTVKNNALYVETAENNILTPTMSREASLKCHRLQKLANNHFLLPANCYESLYSPVRLANKEPYFNEKKNSLNRKAYIRSSTFHRFDEETQEWTNGSLNANFRLEHNVRLDPIEESLSFKTQNEDLRTSINFGTYEDSVEFLDKNRETKKGEFSASKSNFYGLCDEDERISEDSHDAIDNNTSFYHRHDVDQIEEATFRPTVPFFEDEPLTKTPVKLSINGSLHILDKTSTLKDLVEFLTNDEFEGNIKNLIFHAIDNFNNAVYNFKDSTNRYVLSFALTYNEKPCENLIYSDILNWILLNQRYYPLFKSDFEEIAVKMIQKSEKCFIDFFFQGVETLLEEEACRECRSNSSDESQTCFKEKMLRFIRTQNPETNLVRVAMQEAESTDVALDILERAYAYDTDIWTLRGSDKSLIFESPFVVRSSRYFEFLEWIENNKLVAKFFEITFASKYNILHIIARYSNIQYFCRSLEVLQKGALLYNSSQEVAKRSIMDLIERPIPKMMEFNNYTYKIEEIAKLRARSPNSLVFIPPRDQKQMKSLKDVKHIVEENKREGRSIEAYIKNFKEYSED